MITYKTTLRVWMGTGPDAARWSRPVWLPRSAAVTGPSTTLDTRFEPPS